MRQIVRPGAWPMFCQAGSVRAELYFTRWSRSLPISSTLLSLMSYSFGCTRPSWGAMFVGWYIGIYCDVCCAGLKVLMLIKQDVAVGPGD